MEFELGALLLGNVRETGMELGRGAYGVVLEVEVNGTICAAKKLHDLIVQETTLQKFNEEILLHSQQRHPNIVQLIGVCYPPRSQVPMLVMEYLPLSLTQCLEREELSLQMKHSILSDVAKALCYLHGKRPAIVHRDLTANNVLLTPLYSAKISDLGVSRLIDKFKSHQQLTQVPGNAIVMPPEALATKPVYNEKVDVFTYGCLILHVLTGQFPEPTDAFVQYFRIWQSKVAEWDRRSKYIQKIPEEEKDLLPLAKRCLQDRPHSRPDMLTVLQAVEEKCTKSDKTLLHIIREKEEIIDIITLDFTEKIVAKTNKIYETKMELEKISKEKEWFVSELHLLKCDMEALKKSKIENKIEMLERENELHQAMRLVLIDREQNYQAMKRKKEVQTWLGKGVESLEEKYFEICKNRPMLDLFAILAMSVLIVIFLIVSTVILATVHIGFWMIYAATMFFYSFCDLNLLAVFIRDYSISISISVIAIYRYRFKILGITIRFTFYFFKLIKIIKELIFKP